MGFLYRPKIVRYLGPDGRQCRKGEPGARKVVEAATKWYGAYKVDGATKRVPLSANKQAAKKLLSDLETAQALEGAGLVDKTAPHRVVPIDDHVRAFLTHKKSGGQTELYLAEMEREIVAFLGHGRMRTLDDLTAERVEALLARLVAKGTGASTRNKYLYSIRTFVRWCVMTGKLRVDPLATVEAASGAKKRVRRALSHEEFARLIAAARERPLRQALTLQRGPRKGQLGASVRPEARQYWERMGWEHSLIYQTLVYTGLRVGELAAVELRHVNLTGPRPAISIPGELTKNRTAASVPLAPALVEALREWLDATGKKGTDRLFTVGTALVLTLKKDLAAAGIPFRDAQGRTVDAHALRHTCCTWMAMAKVGQRAAQKHMRHKTAYLTSQVYTDASQLDEAETLAAFPNKAG